MVDSCYPSVMQARWPTGYGAWFTINMSRVRIQAAALSSATLGKLFTHTHVPLSPSSIIWYRPMGGDALEVTAGPSESNGFGHLLADCRGPGSAPEPTLVSSMGLPMPLPVMHEVCVQHFKLCEFVFHVLCGSGKNVKINIIFCCLFVINAQYLYWYFYLNLMHWYF